MELALIITFCLIVGGLAALTSFNTHWFSAHHEAVAEFKRNESPNINTKNGQFSVSKTLFLIGPSANHPACRLQRKLIKPTIPMLIREDIAVIEIYGDQAPRRNGDILEHIDGSLLRHAFGAEEGFFVVYVDEHGKTIFSKKSPMLTDMIAERTGLLLTPPNPSPEVANSHIIKRLKAA